MPAINAKHRRYLYRLANAVVGILVVKGVMSHDESSLWLLFINALLGLADANVNE